MTKWTEFNVNMNVRVKLTECGRRLHRENHDALYRNTGVEPSHYRAPKEDAEGWSTWQLWDLMHEFGKSLWNGSKDIPFMLSIQLDAEELLPIEDQSE